MQITPIIELADLAPHLLLLSHKRSAKGIGRARPDDNLCVENHSTCWSRSQGNQLGELTALFLHQLLTHEMMYIFMALKRPQANRHSLPATRKY